MGLRLFFFPNFPGAFIQGATFIPDSRVIRFWTSPIPKIYVLQRYSVSARSVWLKALLHFWMILRQYERSIVHKWYRLELVLKTLLPFLDDIWQGRHCGNDMIKTSLKRRWWAQQDKMICKIYTSQSSSYMVYSKVHSGIWKHFHM